MLHRAPRSPSFARHRCAGPAILSALLLTLPPGPVHAQHPEGSRVAPDGGSETPPEGEVESQPPPPVATGVAGRAVDADREGIEQAQTDVEGAPLDTTVDLPPMPPLQIAAWWTMFGAVVLGTTAGVFAGLSDRQEGEAMRLASRFDLETGMQPLYADEAETYERMLQRGRAFQWTSVGFAVAAGAALVASSTMFSAHAHRRRRQRRVALGVGSLEVRF